MSAPERVPPRRVTPPTTREVLTGGELEVRGRIPHASNAVLFGFAVLDGSRVPCVYKPVAGERPLWDFPDGTLAQREVAAYEVSEAAGWGLVPVTVLRDGPHGQGMCQEWVGPLPGTEGAGQDTGDDTGEDARALLAVVPGEEPGPGWKAVGAVQTEDDVPALLVHADDERLRRLAVLDAVINNADRKGGHLLPAPGGRLYAIDHGVTFHVDDKLRTLLWGWAGEPLPPQERTALRRLSAALAEGTPLAGRLAALLAAPEVEALRKRVEALLATGRHPLPGGEWPAIPWPPV